ncbi:MAG: UDP-2,4-diacetamido-2,4,6-trideoxy-beta-L-altropyranose hydrolase [Omnitrophica bacterium RIFCSPLOWO2_01_FULL_45_10b]|nr:MAG: UDP-2,4-diacetamido-2,4,6-trideoxy-beta-L-altropyranose hydrolase [Omnitrophica bacterium RIFCSPLOWO2_01_FULL_45_10b]
MKAEADFQSPLLAIRADGNASIGMGHMMRTLAIAQAWKARGGRVCYVTADFLSSSARKRFLKEGIEMYFISAVPGSEDDREQTLTVLGKRKPARLLADGYAFHEAYQTAMRAKYPFGYIDDTADLDFFDADLLINPNAYADALLYKGKCAQACLLTGPAFTLLRKEFWNFKRPARLDKGSGPIRILVTLGGGDLLNATLAILNALETLPSENLEIRVIFGEENPHGEMLEKAIKKSEKNITFLPAVDSLVPLMEWASIAVTGGGSTCWEMAYAGVPFLAIILADNQKQIVSFLQSRGILISLGEYNQQTPEKISATIHSLIFDPKKRAEMSRAGQSLIDGKGALRVADALWNIQIPEKHPA